ncbi:MAG: aminoglycoside phosphotransferase [Marmoricola sp.]|nr:aminoglycoside phosphotransferase [Marmoricola sp.]
MEPDLDPAMRGLVDLPALGAWMDGQGLPTGSFDEVAVLTGGTQNLLVRFNRGGHTYVLRRPPRHLRPRSNDNLRREARILTALTGREVRSPALIAACDDESVMGGSAFFLMESIDGFNPSNGLPALHAGDAATRHRMGLSAVEALAALGAVDPEAVGLADFGQPDGFLERQVPRWLGELESYAALDGYPATGLPGVHDLADWLTARLPTTYRPGILHGDFHVANLLFDTEGPELAAILDWEMATIGDPLLDLGWLLVTWPSGDGSPVDVLAQKFAGEGGLASRAELVARYAEHSTRDLGAIHWYAALAGFKLGIVLEGTYARACAGKADLALGEMFHVVACSLIERAQDFTTDVTLQPDGGTR